MCHVQLLVVRVEDWFDVRLTAYSKCPVWTTDLQRSGPLWALRQNRGNEFFWTCSPWFLFAIFSLFIPSPLVCLISLVSHGDKEVGMWLKIKLQHLSVYMLLGWPIFLEALCQAFRLACDCLCLYNNQMTWREKKKTALIILQFMPAVYWNSAKGTLWRKWMENWTWNSFSCPRLPKCSCDLILGHCALSWAG